jgi:imidazolonepropionase
VSPGRLPADFLLLHAGQLVTAAGGHEGLGIRRDGALAARAGTIVWTGASRDWERKVRLEPSARRMDAAGACVIPGLVDAHTHLVFAGTRADEYAARVTGEAYRAQQGVGRGITRTVRSTRAASPATLRRLGRARLRRFLQHGTTTLEAKSGYALDLAGETKILEVVAALRRSTPMHLVSTFLAHVVPPEFTRARRRYLRLLTGTMLPALRRRADFCDAWCEPGVAFTLAEVREIFQAAGRLGYRLRLHADQLRNSGGARLAAAFGAASADHLEHADAAGIRALAQAGVVAVLLPGTHLGSPALRPPPLRALQQAGVRVALATDFNPGTSYSESLQVQVGLACGLWGMSPAAALLGVTRHAAAALGLEGRAGTLTVGARCDLVVLDADTCLEIPYHFGVNLARTVVVAGKAV